ncbi:hypothetical protein PIROE2DRAFT_13193 [Piromyces sp. E2]|nr:hypothetical protein PIROE2DRAFT_13193 [Piromyces sp. E2]|eukprot:OUM60941.1 hypothetical protein PIROE2DRAFT_13193 [Piromyces sp. E2]
MEVELENFMKENNIDANNYNDAIIYSIENNAPVDLLQYILSQRTDTNLNLEIFYDNNNYVPLFFAIQKNNFALANLLIANGANINYISREQNIIIYLLNNNLYNNVNIKYVLNKGFYLNNFTNEFIIDLIEKEKTDFLEIILQSIKYDNNFFLELLNIYKNKNILTDKQLYNIIKKEKEKVIITDALYQKAIEKKNNALLRILFENDSSKDSIILKRIIKYNLLEVAVKSNCYNFVKKVLCFDTFNNKCMNYESIFQEAIANSDIEISKLLITSFIKDSIKEMNNSSVEMSNKNYISKLINLVLNIVIKFDNLTLVKYIIELETYKDSIDINLKDINDEYPIVTAFYLDNVDIFRYLLEQGADCNTKNDCGISLLLLAIHNNKGVMLEQLIEHHVNINEIDVNGVSPILKAINQNSSEIVESLIDYANEYHIPIDINKKDNYGQYPLIKAINQNNFDIVFSIINYGYENKIDMNVKSINGDTPLTLSYKLNRYDIFNYLVKFLDVNQIDSEGKSVLFYAIINKDVNSVRNLINAGANINLKDTSNNSIIDYAIDKKLINKFIEKGSNINLVDDDGNSPLIYAIQNNYISIVEILFNSGTNVDIKNKEGNTALNYAFNSKNKQIINYLYDKGYDVYNITNNVISFELMKTIIANNNNELFERIIKSNSFNINKQENGTGNTLLHIAVYEKKVDIIKCLITNGANKEIRNNNSLKPQDINYRQNYRNYDKSNIPILNLLLQKNNISVNIVISKHETPMISLLKSNKYNENEKRELINKFIEKAVKFKNTNIIRCLLVMGASKNIRNNRKETPQDINYNKNYNSRYSDDTYYDIKRILDRY